VFKKEKPAEPWHLRHRGVQERKARGTLASEAPWCSRKKARGTLASEAPWCSRKKSPRNLGIRGK